MTPEHSPPHPQETKDLRSDDPVAFGRFIGRYQISVFGFLGRMGFGQTDTEDLAQEIFIRAWRSRKSYQPERARISTWLFTIARNTALNEIDRRRRRPPIDDHNYETVVDSSPSNRPDSQLELSQKRDRLHLALQQLSIEDRDTISLAFVEGLSANEACEVLGCSAGTYRTRLSRAKQRLLTVVQSHDKPKGNSS